MPDPLLQIKSLTVRYGPIVALSDVTLEVHRGEIVALLGANGAGKTTLAGAISGLVPVARGTVVMDGEEIQGRAAHRIARLGLIQVPEGRGVLSDLTVRENLLLGAALGRAANRHAAVAAAVERFSILRDRMDQRAGTLSGGEQQMLVLARAVLSRPRLLVLDEPSLGLAPRVVAQTFALISELAGDGIAVLLIEQNVAMSLRVAARAYVLAGGVVQIQGSAAELGLNPAVRKAYLGGDIEASEPAAL